MQTHEIELFKSRFSQFLNIDIEFKFNENHSVMLHILQKRPFVRLSIHKMFLQAPDAVLNALSYYVRGSKKNGALLRSYIQQQLATSLPKAPGALIHQGSCYNLKTLYDAVNEEYFNNSLDLSITWYGRKMRGRTRITFGKYLPQTRLVQIHKKLDHSFFPDYFVKFVVYHEMLHSVVGGSTDKRGRFCFHTREFREKEKLFVHYHQALAWEKQHIKQILA